MRRDVLAKGEWVETWARHAREEEELADRGGFFSSRLLPHLAYYPVSASSLHGQRHLRSRRLNARPNDPQRKNRLPAD